MFRKNSEFAEIYSNYYSIVFSTIYTKLNNIDDTEDLCQEIFSRMYMKLEEITDKRKWLFGAIRLELLAFYRNKKKREVDIDDLFQEAGMTFVNGFRDARIIIQDTLDNMGEICDDQERNLFELIAIKRFTYEEAGSQLALTKRQVRYKYSQVIKKLLDSLNNKGIKSLEELL